MRILAYDHGLNLIRGLKPSNLCRLLNVDGDGRAVILYYARFVGFVKGGKSVRVVENELDRG